MWILLGFLYRCFNWRSFILIHRNLRRFLWRIIMWLLFILRKSRMFRRSYGQWIQIFHCLRNLYRIILPIYRRRWLSRIMLSFILLKILFHNQFILRLCWSIYLIICLERKTRLCCSRCLRLVILYRWNLIQLWNFSWSRSLSRRIYLKLLVNQKLMGCIMGRIRIY